MTMSTRMMTEPLKPALAALLAIAYLAAWWAFGSPPRPPAVTEPTVWYGDLPESQRPDLHLPQGWYLAPGARAPAIRPAPLVRPARAVPARPGRIRTRSS